VLRHILIIKLSSIGDVVHALPVASALKLRYPEARITWAAEDWTAPLVTGHPAIDRVVTFPAMMGWPRQPGHWWSQMRGAIRTLREEQYDAAVDLQGLAKSAAISFLSKAPYRLARAGQREGAYLVSTGVPMPDDPIHAVDEYLLVAQALGAEVEPVEFRLPISTEARASVERLLLAAGVAADDPVIVVNPSAAQAWKHWPSERWSQVIDGLADLGRIVVIGTTSQASAHAAIVASADSQPIDLTGRTTLGEVAALLERARLHLAPDTGTVHMAVALGTPVVAIYGPTSAVRVGPYRQPASALSHGEPCGRLCPTVCLHSRRCLSAITAVEVIDRARQLMGQRPRRQCEHQQ
jgi:lipopolysaccharide heptosyltransferase I